PRRSRPGKNNRAATGLPPNSLPLRPREGSPCIPCALLKEFEESFVGQTGLGNGRLEQTDFQRTAAGDRDDEAIRHLDVYVVAAAFLAACAPDAHERRNGFSCRYTTELAPGHLPGRRSCRFRLAHRLNDRLHERGQVVRLAARNDIPVTDHLSV